MCLIQKEKHHLCNMVFFQKSHLKATYLATHKKPNSPRSKGDQLEPKQY